MAKRPTADDARLILELYDLRREPELRKARQWWLMTFWPKNADDFVKVATAMGSEENNWLRQVGSYWGIAVSFVLNGVVSEKLFFQLAFCGELYFIFAKVRPFLTELREKMNNPDLFLTMKRPSWDRRWRERNLKKSSRVWRRCGSSDKSAKRESNSNVADVVRGGMPWAFAGVASGWSDGEGSGELHCGGNLAIERAGIEMARQRAHQRHHVAPDQRFAAGEADLAHALGDEGRAQPVEFFQRQEIGFRQKSHVLGHAIETAQIAAIGHRHAQIPDGPAERIDHRTEQLIG